MKTRRGCATSLLQTKTCAPQADWDKDRYGARFMYGLWTYTKIWILFLKKIFNNDLNNRREIRSSHSWNESEPYFRKKSIEAARYRAAVE